MDNAELNESTNEKPLRWGAVAAGIGVGFVGALLCLSVVFALYMALALNFDFANLEDADALGEKLEQGFLRNKYEIAVVFFSIAGLFFVHRRICRRQNRQKRARLERRRSWRLSLPRSSGCFRCPTCLPSDYPASGRCISICSAAAS